MWFLLQEKILEVLSLFGLYQIIKTISSLALKAPKKNFFTWYNKVAQSTTVFIEVNKKGPVPKCPFWRDKNLKRHYTLRQQKQPPEKEALVSLLTIFLKKGCL